MTDSLFEVITEDEFKASTSAPSLVEDVGVGELTATGEPTPTLTWCEFCKGYYIMEFHHGDTSDELLAQDQD